MGANLIALTLHNNLSSKANFLFALSKNNLDNAAKSYPLSKSSTNAGQSNVPHSAGMRPTAEGRTSHKWRAHAPQMEDVTFPCIFDDFDGESEGLSDAKPSI